MKADLRGRLRYTLEQKKTLVDAYLASGLCAGICYTWRAVASSDETTPGTALIALSRGYERDQQEQSLAKVRQQALELARNPDTGLWP